MIVKSNFVSWLRDTPSESGDEKYRHRLLTEYPNKREEIFDELSEKSLTETKTVKFCKRSQVSGYSWQENTFGF